MRKLLYLAGIRMLSPGAMAAIKDEDSTMLSAIKYLKYVDSVRQATNFETGLTLQ